MLSYLIVGSGYRSEYYARLTRKYPALFRAMFLCRSEEKAAAVSQRTGVAATASLEDALRFCPDFAVIAVNREQVGHVAEEWVGRGFPVVTETPVGSSVAQLRRLWQLRCEQGARIVCSEQYHRYPILAAGLAEIEKGTIGRPLSACLSLAHEYHGFSLICRALQTCGERFTLRAARVSGPVVATDSRYGAILDGSTAQEERDIAFISFASGKTAVYDFAAVQYRSFLRSRHLTVRGERGEWSDRILTYADESAQPRRLFLMPELAPRYRVLDTQALRDLRKTWSAELFLDTEQDEFAIASLLLDMGDYLSGGPEPYPLSDALHDAYFTLLLKQAVETPWQPVASEPMPWSC